MLEQRLVRAREEMARMELDCMAVTPASDLAYLIGYRGMAMERPTIFLLTHEDAVLLVPAFEQGNVPGGVWEQVRCVPWTETEDPYQKLGKQIAAQRWRAAICEQAPSFIYHNLRKTFPGWSWELGGGLMGALRSRKDAQEIENLRTANHMAGKALLRLLQVGLCGKTELGAGELLRQYCVEEGMTAQSVGIVASGPNSALPHYHTGTRVIAEGDVVVIDFGADYKGYQSDMTRTVAVRRRPAGFDEIYNTVRDANEAAFRACKLGASYASIDEAGRRVIERAGYGQYFTHRLGHGIGMDVHEPPYIIAGNKGLLQEGNVFSDEPGIYIAGRFGVRIEDIIAMMAQGPERLTDVTREIMIVE